MTQESLSYVGRLTRAGRQQRVPTLGIHSHCRASATTLEQVRSGSNDRWGMWRRALAKNLAVQFSGKTVAVRLVGQ